MASACGSEPGVREGFGGARWRDQRVRPQRPSSNKELLLSALSVRAARWRSLAYAKVPQQNSETLGGGLSRVGAMKPNIVGVPLQPADLERSISVLEEAIADLRRWGLRVPELGRLQAHLKTLRGVQDAGEFPLDSGRRTVVAHALRDASDFAAIAIALEPARMEAIATELARTMGGTPHQSERGREAYQFQSQFFCGAVMSAAGVYLRASTGAGPYPDFVVDNGTLRHGIEVKRPESSRGVERGLRSAATQLAAVDGGMVVMDLSDGLQSDLVLPVQKGEGFHAWHSETDSRFRASVRTVTELVGRRAFSNATHVLSVGFFARGWLWHEVGPSGGPALPEFFGRFYVETLAQPAGTLMWHRGEFLCGTFELGLQNLMPRVHQVRADW